MTDHGLLRTHLAFAVPLRIEELQQQPDWALDQLAATLGDRILTADAMQYGGGRPGEAARSIGAWTTTLALLALRSDGGIDFNDQHWCALSGCRASSRYEHAPDTDELPDPPDEPRPRPIVDLHLPDYTPSRH